jgi:SAM-dependent methyltransferase
MNWRVNLFLMSERFLGRIPKVAGLHSIVWLQVLRPADLDEITRLSYSGEDAVGFAGQEHNSWGLWDWEAQAFTEALMGRSRILVLGAGAGREVIALAKMGHEVLGIEPSEVLVAAGQQNLRDAGVAGEILCVPPTQVPLDIGTFDAAIIGRGVYHHIPRAARRIRFLQDCRDRLGPSAPLVIGDFQVRTSERRGWDRLAGRLRDELGDRIGSCFFHYFSAEEIELELAMAGFKLVSFRPTPFPRASSSLAHVLARVLE